HEVERLDALGQRQHAHARLQLDPLGPATEQAVLRARRDAVDLAFRAARAGLRDQAVPAAAADAVDVVEGDQPSGADGSAVDVRERAAGLEHAPAADVAGDDRV